MRWRSCWGSASLSGVRLNHDQLRTDPMLAVAVNKASGESGGGRPQIGGRRWRAGVR